MISFLNNFRSLTISKSLFNVKNNGQFLETLAGYKSKSIEQRLGIPEKPKKPLSPYFRFLTDNRTQLLAKNPKISANDIIKIGAERWKTVEPDQKQKYQLAYDQEKIAYINNRAKYDNTLTPDQKLDIKQLKQELMHAREQRQKRKEIRALGKPKRPSTPFLTYLTEQIKIRDKTELYKNWHKRCIDKWNSFNDSDKEIYVKQYAIDQAKYKEALKNWEEKMLREGHTDLVRKCMLIDPPRPRARKTIVRE